ncbi:MAG: hypothetical protein MHM6MM_003741 [Cercozoa sp. M6MM]
MLWVHVLRVCTALVCAAAAQDASAEQLNMRALQHAQAGELQQALELFEEARLQDLNNADYCNNVGVTYLRMQMPVTASATFERCLELDAQHADLLDNRDVAQKFLRQRTEQRVASQMAQWDRLARQFPAPEAKQLPRVPVSQFHWPKHRRYWNGEAAFVLTGVFDPKEHDEWNSKRLLDLFGTQFRAELYPNNLQGPSEHPVFQPLSIALEELAHPLRFFATPNGKNAYAGERLEATYLHLNLKKAEWSQVVASVDFSLLRPFTNDDEWLSQCLSPELQDEFQLRTHWRLLLAGQVNAGMFMHQDALRTSSWHLTLRGTKRWFICPPHATKQLCGDKGASPLNAFLPESAKCEFRDLYSLCYDEQVGAGDLVFYPSDYWHQTTNAADGSVTVTSTVVNSENVAKVRQALVDECSTGKFHFALSSELCQALSAQCFPLWQRMF